MDQAGGRAALAGGGSGVRPEPDDVEWFVAEHEGFSLREAGLERADADGVEQADAQYFSFTLSFNNKDDLLQWDELRNPGGKIPVFLRAEVLQSEEHALYVISHELFELGELRRLFASGPMTYERLAHLIEPKLGGPVHRDAVEHGDSLVGRLRRERGIGP
jgi:hypothetical protein